MPAVSRVLASRSAAPLRRRLGVGLLTVLIRSRLEALRVAIRDGGLGGDALAAAVAPGRILVEVGRLADALLEPRPRRVINATGVVIHTNLGRSPLSAAAAQAVARTASGYLDLEFDVEAGRRGSRMSHLEPLMAHLFPGQAFLALNNNAAAILVCLRALARRREVVVSRGELVEIGGAFRIPDVLEVSGARLVEVGTTNRTRTADYAAALGPRTGMILKVHPSNFRIVGFTEEAPIAELAAAARGAGLPLVVDWGSGDLVDLHPLGLVDELPVANVLAQGADLVTFSADKLLGGPQAGLVVGRADLVERIKKDPLSRVCRLDRLAIAALHATLTAYVRQRAFEEVPTLQMLSLSAEEIGRRAARLRSALAARGPWRSWLRLVDGVSRTGGGSSPLGERPSRLLAIGGAGLDAGRIERELRRGRPPVVGRLHDGDLLLDLRTVAEDETPELLERLVVALTARAVGKPLRRRD